MKKSQLKPYLKAGVTAFLVILASTVAYFIMLHINAIADHIATIRYILRPIFMGMILAFLLLPVYKAIYKVLDRLAARKKEPSLQVRRLINGTSIFLSLVFAFLLIYILLAMVIPQVYISVVRLIQNVPDYLRTVQQWILGYLEDNPDFKDTFLSASNSTALSIEGWLNQEILPHLESLSTTVEWLREYLLPNISGVITSVSSAVIEVLLCLKDILIAAIVSVYLLARKDIFSAQSKKIIYSIFPTRYGDMIVEETRNAYHITSGFINGKLLDSLIIGIITLVCCNLFRFPYPALIAVIIGVTNVIPFFGPFIGAIPSAFLILLVDPLKFLYFVIFIFVLQQFDGNILGPKILGESTGLASFWVLFSILLFGGLFGFAGMVLGVPFFAILYSIVRRLVNRGLRRRKMSVNTEDYMGNTGKLSSACPEPTETNETES